MTLYDLLILLALLSLVAFLLYGLDKWKAKRGKWRIPELWLLGIGLLGGGPGALLGMYLFHHKTRHWYFWIVNVMGLLLCLMTAALLKFQSFFF